MNFCLFMVFSNAISVNLFTFTNFSPESSRFLTKLVGRAVLLRPG
jgi:hypothetical protein